MTCAQLAKLLLEQPNADTLHIIAQVPLHNAKMVETTMGVKSLHGRFWWFSGGDFPRDSSFVEPELFALMGDDCEDSWSGDADAAGYCFPTEAAAHDALARAAICWALTQAKGATASQ